MWHATMCDTFNVTLFQRQDEEDARTVYVRNLHPKINEQQLREHFSMFGAIKRIVLPQDAHQIGSNRGFTFITFASKEPVEVACSLGKTLGGVSEHLARAISSQRLGKLALWEMFHFRQLISFTNFHLSFEHFNETWKAEFRELKKVSVKDKIAAFSSKVEEKPAKKIGSLSQSKWRSSSLRKAGYWLAQFCPIRMLFLNYPMNSSPVKISTCTSNNYPH